MRLTSDLTYGVILEFFLILYTLLAASAVVPYDASRAP